MSNETEINLLEDIETIPTASETETLSSQDVLNELSEGIGPLDFKLLAYPEISEVTEEMETLKPSVFEKDGSFSKDNEIEVKEYRRLQKKLNGFKLNRNHYLIICVEKLLDIAEINNWGLCKRNGSIYIFNGSYWIEVEKDRFQHFLGNAALKMGVEKYKGKIHTFKEELYKQFLSEAYLPTPPENRNSVLINLQNGTFDISPNKQGLREFRQEDFITHQLPFEYDPDANAPLFQKYLDEVLPDTDKQKILAEYCGYIFTKTNVLKLEKMLILYGSGANGKSVFFEIINALLGPDNVSNYSLHTLTDEKGYHRAKIANKLVNYASEINGKLEVDTFKNMASGEPIDARLPYGEPFILHDYAKMVFNCNTLPRDVEHTTAFFRRFLIVGFDVTIPEAKQDKELSKKIIDHELSGVFNWVLAGLDRILKQKNFSKCEAVDNARGEYERQSDSVKTFIDEYSYQLSATEYTTVSNLYGLYRGYCVEDGFRAVNKSNFMKRLAHYKIEVKRMSVGNVAYVTRKEGHGTNF